MNDGSDDQPLFPPDPAGGQGGSLVIDPHHTRAHLALIERMIREGTLTPQDQREVRDTALILMRQTEKPREKVAALRVLSTLERSDLLKLKVAIDSARAPAGSLHLHNHNELHVHGGRELPEELSVEELRKLARLGERPEPVERAALDQGRQQGQGAEGGAGGEGSPPERPDANPLQDRPE